MARPVGARREGDESGLENSSPGFAYADSASMTGVPWSITPYHDYLYACRSRATLRTPMVSRQKKQRPASTYRLQLTPDFDFQKARELLRYLGDLGVDWLYLSPILEARPGSEHGYDVTDPTLLREELGGDEGFEALSYAASQREMGILLDIVPNHMAASPHSRRWMQVLADGAASPWSHWFDINWRARGRPGALETHVLLPILGRPYGSVLESGELKLSFEAGALFVDYHDWRLPLSPRSWPLVLEQGMGVMRATLGDEHPAVEGLNQLFSLTSKLPPWTATDPDAQAVRHRGVREARAMLQALVNAIPQVSEHLEQNLRTLAGTPGKPECFDRLDSILSVQPYRLCFWKLATERVSYRRFFDIGSLIGVRVEDRRVFRETHDRVLELVREGKVQGLRLDHIDGLLDPRGYLRRLRRVAGRRAYILVEKILAADEDLPGDWPVQGTTGYESLHTIMGPFVDRRGLHRLARSWSALPGVTGSFALLVHRCKLMVLETLFGGELQALISDLVLAAERDRHGRDISPRQLGNALLEVTAALSVYRTYLQGHEVSPTDRQRIESAIAFARRQRPTVDRHAYDMIGKLLTLSFPHGLTPAARRGWRRVVQRWQQLTGPAMAKGLEDTALYVDARLIVLNEVGADTETIESPVDPAGFHSRISQRHSTWPDAMLSSSTHDSKRSEDVRARLLFLSEMAGEWESALARWSRWHKRLAREVDGRMVPDAATARFVYQTLLGVWPLNENSLPAVSERVQAYLRKAAREAKVHSSWIEPNEAYEEALLGFASDLFEPDLAPRFHEHMRELVPRVAFFGAINSLAMTHLKLTLPGVPDTYQGNELWRLDLADPDNRRPVDFEKRQQLLYRLDADERRDRDGLIREMLEHWTDGRVKLYLISRLLRHRRANRRQWEEAGYLPLHPVGKRRGNVLAFARVTRSKWMVSIVPRLTSRFVDLGRFPLGEEVWGRTAVGLPPDSPERFTDVLSGREVSLRRRFRRLELPLSTVLGGFPTALLISN